MVLRLERLDMPRSSSFQRSATCDLGTGSSSGSQDIAVGLIIAPIQRQLDLRCGVRGQPDTADIEMRHSEGLEAQMTLRHLLDGKVPALTPRHLH